MDAVQDRRTRAATEQALARASPAAPPASTAVIAAERVAIVGEAVGAFPSSESTLALAAAGTMTSADSATALGIPPARCATGCPWPGAPWPRHSAITMIPGEER